MLRFLINILFFPLAGMVLFSCKKGEINSYQNDPAIYITTKGDSIRYSFAIQPGSVAKDTIWINVRISGDSSDVSRPISFTATGSTTAIEGLHYKLPDYQLPADRFTASLPVVIYRTPDLQSKEVLIDLHLNSNDNFKTSFNPVNFKILLNDILTKPTNWESTFELRFGKYSQVKYQFLIDVLGSEAILKLTTGSGVLINEMLAYRQKVINALNDYVAIHGPLIDENGSSVAF